MELKIVHRPLQDKYTEKENLEYAYFVTEDNQLKEIIPHWRVKSYFYRERDGGIQLWLKEIERVKPDIIYLYEIKSWNDKGLSEENWFEDTIHCIKCDMRIL
jgi:SpoVK/Ycf46/Vps4 family AAA+-type ATPase